MKKDPLSLFHKASLKEGFSLSEGAYERCYPLNKGAMSLKVRVTKESVEYGCYDQEGEEYVPFGLPNANGTYINALREEARGILLALKASAFVEEERSKQEELILEFAKRSYGELRDYPFDTKTHSVLRREDNKKWYLLFTEVHKQNLGFEAAEGDVVINIRCQKGQASSLMEEKAIHRAYHMNHESWVSVHLDHGLSDQRLLELLEQSRELAKKSK